MSEYCLLTALVALIALGIFIYASGGVQNLWTVANTSLGNASTSSTAASAGSGAGSGTHSTGH